MKRLFIIVLFYAAFASLKTVSAQTIAVDPTGVNVNSQNPTTVFLTFGQIPAGYAAAEAIWCGELIPAPAPALGQQCRPDTIFGALPARFNRSTTSGNAGFTDIMAIPPAVVRRAYLAAVGGSNSSFFYVRRFASNSGQPDQFVNVTCRMTGGGARVPFSLTNVELRTPANEPVLYVNAGRFPEIEARISYNGTGRLKGRWEIVLPGEEIPDERDLLTEATLPAELRGTQRRYTQVATFNHFLPPTGSFTLKLKPKGRQLLTAAGQYILLLRIEAVDDKESDSNLGALGVGNGVVHSGAVASFPMPTLRMFVTGSKSWSDSTELTDFSPGSAVSPLFRWLALGGAAAYILDINDESGTTVFSAVVKAPATDYRAPSWLFERLKDKTTTWFITALNEKGGVIQKTTPRKISQK